MRGITTSGVYANGRTVVVQGRLIQETGVYELYFHAFENTVNVEPVTAEPIESIDTLEYEMESTKESKIFVEKII